MAVSTWYRFTLVVKHEQTIRYGAIPGGRPERIACHTLSPHSAGRDDPDCNCRPLASRQSVDVAAKASRVVFKSLLEWARGIDTILLCTDDAVTYQTAREVLAIRPLGIGLQEEAFHSVQSGFTRLHHLVRGRYRV